VNRSFVCPLAIAAIGVVILFSCALLLEAQEPRSSVFTTEQAEAGRVAYAKHCASCHMPDLSGDNERPPLVGTSFMATWGSRSTKEFLAYMTGAMPYGAPALDADTYAALTAYILQSNGASAGGQALGASTDVSIGSVTGKPQAPTIRARE
jgi:mono/diheme cytochrome c family protein